MCVLFFVVYSVSLCLFVVMSRSRAQPARTPIRPKLYNLTWNDEKERKKNIIIILLYHTYIQNAPHRRKYQPEEREKCRGMRAHTYDTYWLLPEVSRQLTKMILAYKYQQHNFFSFVRSFACFARLHRILYDFVITFSRRASNVVRKRDTQPKRNGTGTVLCTVSSVRRREYERRRRKEKANRHTMNTMHCSQQNNAFLLFRSTSWITLSPLWVYVKTFIFFFFLLSLLDFSCSHARFPCLHCYSFNLLAGQLN